MSESEWRELIYRSAGVPYAVAKRDEMAAELIVRELEIATPAVGAALATHWAAAEIVLKNLPAALPDGELDRVIAGLESLDDSHAQNLADRVSSDGPTASARKARKSVLEVLLPKLVKHAKKYEPPSYPGQVPPP